MWVNNSTTSIYFGSMVDSEIEDCFLISHETKHPPIKYGLPLVLFLSSRLPAQSTFVYTINSNYLVLGYHRPRYGVPLIYKTIIFITIICESLGAYQNLATIPTKCVISNLEAVRYKILPIIELYGVESTKGDSSSLLSLQLVVSGVLIGAQSSMPNFLIIFSNTLTE